MRHPDHNQRAAVLGAVKARPGNDRACGQGRATADLDSPCARRPPTPVGRGEENMAAEPRFFGYSIGRWLDEDSDGRYDTLVVETRGMKGPRVYDATGIPLHADNETVVKERIYLDKSDKNLLHDDITTIDHALTRPWVVNKAYRRVASDKPIWFGHQVYGEGNAHVGIGKEVYYLSGDGLLMPAKKDQPPPDLRYFKKYDR
jgi:hypothetical protein